jgi:hypothetical protein
VCGTLSVAIPIAGSIAALVLGMQARNWADAGAAMLIFKAITIGGVVLAATAFGRRERWSALPVCGLLLSIGLGLYYLRIWQ